MIRPSAARRRRESPPSDCRGVVASPPRAGSRSARSASRARSRSRRQRTTAERHRNHARLPGFATSSERRRGTSEANGLAELGRRRYAACLAADVDKVRAVAACYAWVGVSVGVWAVNEAKELGLNTWLLLGWTAAAVVIVTCAMTA